MSPARVGFNAPSSKNSRLIFAQQPRPNDKRNPLLHVLRTAGTTGRFIEGPRGQSEAAQRPTEGGQGSEFRVQEKWERAEQPCGFGGPALSFYAAALFGLVAGSPRHLSRFLKRRLRP